MAADSFPSNNDDGVLCKGCVASVRSTPLQVCLVLLHTCQSGCVASVRSTTVGQDPFPAMPIRRSTICSGCRRGNVAFSRVGCGDGGGAPESPMPTSRIESFLYFTDKDVLTLFGSIKDTLPKPSVQKT